MLDKFNRYQTTETEGIELLYRGHDLKNTEFAHTDDIELYNQLCEQLDMQNLTTLAHDDFDRTAIFNIPQHYKDIDIEEYIVKLIPHAEDQTDKLAYLKRVEEELALYKARNLYPVLQLLIYIIDTMRINGCVWGVGRGSSVASYILYLIGVHKIDSIKYNLDITEFLKED